MIGRTLGHYRILEKIGAGGMGEVYRARDERLERDVAIKVLPAGTLADEPARKRFRKEALALSKLNHPNIQTVHDFDTQDGIDFLVTEYVPGVTLGDRLGGKGLVEKEVLRLGQQLAEGLAAAHEQGVIHRDLKPSNLRVTPDGRLKILDFGVAKLRRPESPTATTQSLTETQTFAGTPLYMAPEQRLGEAVDARSDIYSAGLVLREMATGQPPPRPGEGPPTLAGLSPRLEQVIEKCLERDSECRYQSARELAVDLRRLEAAGAEVSKGWLKRPRWALGAGGALLAIVAVAVGFNVGGVRNRLFLRENVIDSIAVLPLKNLSGDVEQDYFVEGMHEALITELSKIRALRVISRTSAMHYKGTNKRLPEIARELGVDAVVEGSVLQAGGRVRVTAQLVAAVPEEHHLWANSFDRELKDILTLHSELAQAIATQIKVNVTPEEQARLARVRSVDPEAYQLYLKGNFQLMKLSEEGFRKGVEHYQEAIQKDPQFAQAYAGLADAYWELGGWHGALPTTEVRAKAKRAVAKALELDDTLAEAYMALGNIKYLEWDWSGAEAAFKKGVELKTPSAYDRVVYANYLTAMGRFEESIAIARTAVEIDPLQPSTYNELGWALENAGRAEEALEQYRRGLELDPDYHQSYIILAQFYFKQGMHQEAIAACQKVRKLVPELKGYMALAAYVYAKAGRRTEAREILDQLKRRAPKEYVSPVTLALPHIALGETEMAMHYLEKGYQERDIRLVFLRVDWTYDPLRSDPRFQNLLRRMKFPS